MMGSKGVLLLFLTLLHAKEGTSDIVQSGKDSSKQGMTNEDSPGSRDESCLNILACAGFTGNITQEGTICMPLIGEEYLNNLDCSWRISAPIGTVVKLEFSEMDTEECSSCSCDYVSVHDGPNISGNQLAKLCGSERGTVYYSRYQDIFVHFFSDQLINGKGFRATVTFTPTPRIAFHAVRQMTLDATTQSVKVDFNAVTINDGNSFDVEKSEFTCTVPGPYFFSISAGAQVRKPVEVILRKNRYKYVSLIRTSAEPSAVEMFSRSVIIELEVGDIIDVELFRYTSLYSDGDFQTSFLGFHLPFVSEYAYMFVARPDNLTQATGYIPGFEKKMVSIGGWTSDSENMNMYFPYDGIYYSEISSGIVATKYVRIYVTSSYSEAYSGSFGSEGYTTISSSYLASATTGDILTMYSGASPELMTNHGLQISITSFLLASENYTRSYFRSYRTSTISTPGNIPFTIEISHDVSFSPTTGTFTCIVPGVYFVHVSCSVSSSRNAVVGIIKNGQPVTKLTRYIIDQSYYSHISRNLVVHLESGDQLYLSLYEGSLYSTTSNRATTFSALLLYEDVEFLSNTSNKTKM